ncbi:MAG: sigma-70 family RNA polymerase sigma factor [Candidatus Omnitrophica bacterium]|nr:sigma-70 family RNA polymerase sigma factor [Candidatus Omnitrophota bacterium]
MSYNKGEDEILIKSFLSGDRKSFDAIINKYKNLVFNISIKMLGNYEEALDISQDIFIKLYGSLKNFKFESQFSTYLYRITMNFCKNRLISLHRRRKKETFSLDDSIAAESGGIKREVKSNRPNPRQILDEKEYKNVILQAVNTLKTEYKQIIVLKDIEGLKYEEISDVLNIDLGTVRSRLHRARCSLRIKLEGISL